MRGPGVSRSFPRRAPGVRRAGPVRATHPPATQRCLALPLDTKTGNPCVSVSVFRTDGAQRMHAPKFPRHHGSSDIRTTRYEPARPDREPMARALLLLHTLTRSDATPKPPAERLSSRTAPIRVIGRSHRNDIDAGNGAGNGAPTRTGTGHVQPVPPRTYNQRANMTRPNPAAATLKGRSETASSVGSSYLPCSSSSIARRRA